MKNNNIEVLHVITDLDDGGAEAVLYRLCLFDRKNKHRVISLMDEGKYGRLLEEKGIPVHCLNMMRGKVTIKGIFRLAALMRKYRSDVVQTWMYHSDLLGGCVARLVCVKRVVWGIHHSNLDTGSSKGSTILVARLCALLSGIIPRRIISCSYRAKQIHQAMGYKGKKIVVIPNGYDLINFRINKEAGLKVRIELGVTTQRLILGMVARFDPQKDHETLITALAFLKRKGYTFSCLLVGPGMCRENVKLIALIDNYDVWDCVVLCGQRTDIPSVMNCLDINILSSVSEAFPNVLAEAMACGTPCVATDVGDAGLIIGDTGWIVSSRKPEALSNAIECGIRARSELESWQERQRACQVRIEENFNIERVVDLYNRVWRKVLSEDLII